MFGFNSNSGAGGYFHFRHPDSLMGGGDLLVLQNKSRQLPTGGTTETNHSSLSLPDHHENSNPNRTENHPELEGGKRPRIFLFLG